jgi:hypothetical protein
MEFPRSVSADDTHPHVVEGDCGTTTAVREGLSTVVHHTAPAVLDSTHTSCAIEHLQEQTAAAASTQA